MVCQACLRENDPFAKYCRDCGRGLTGQAAEGSGAIGVWSDRPRRCASCGETIPPRSRFCSECGSAPTAVARSSRRPGMILGLVVVGVLIVAVFAAIVIPGYFG
jgi:predicted nucleic acid-binding Zn ribbon protein